MNVLLKLHFKPEEYLELEDQAEYRSEYVDGEIFAMAGTQPAHNQIVGNIQAGLHRRFQGRACNTYFTDIRLRAAEGNMYTYPDVMALCASTAAATWVDSRKAGYAAQNQNLWRR